MATVTAPVADFSGEVVGVTFQDGRATTTDPKALAYFRRHGYGIDGGQPAGDPPPPPDPRDITEETVGTRLRDAAVDPRPGDFLPPTNAGEPGELGNPHGPHVVAPEIHGSQGTRPVKPGVVADSTPVQEAAEETHLEQHTDVEVEPSERPAKNAGKPAWVAYAVTQGADPDEAEATSKQDLIATYGED